MEGPLAQDWIGLCLSLVPNVHLHLDPAPKPFYDDFSNGFNSTKWLKAHKSWGSVDNFKNGGVVEENVYFDESAEKVILKAHGSLYNGDIMGVERGENGHIIWMDTGVRTGVAIARRDYFGAGSYEVRMKIAESLYEFALLFGPSITVTKIIIMECQLSTMKLILNFLGDLAHLMKISLLTRPL